MKQQAAPVTVGAALFPTMYVRRTSCETRTRWQSGVRRAMRIEPSVIATPWSAAPV